MKPLKILSISVACCLICACSLTGADDNLDTEIQTILDSGPGVDSMMPDTAKLEIVVGDIVGCQHWHYPQDYAYGDDCWAPPQNLCRDGATTDQAWFCKPDGSLCCFSASSSCFLCGFNYCGSPGPNSPTTEECKGINIPQKYLNCGKYIMGEGEDCQEDVREQMLNGQECANPFYPEDPNYTYCWDDYVD